MLLKTMAANPIGQAQNKQVKMDKASQFCGRGVIGKMTVGLG